MQRSNFSNGHVYQPYITGIIPTILAVSVLVVVVFVSSKPCIQPVDCSRAAGYLACLLLEMVIRGWSAIILDGIKPRAFEVTFFSCRPAYTY
jgi:hypothetical protein